MSVRLLNGVVALIGKCGKVVELANGCASIPPTSSTNVWRREKLFSI